MGLNCKPGDLAIVVSAGSRPSAEDFALIGRIFKLTVPDTYPWHEALWFYEGAPQYINSSELISISDAVLRPIRPGDLTQEDVDALYLPQVIKQRDPEAA